jgi:soluble lytic murein transglycosylase-like protein
MKYFALALVWSLALAGLLGAQTYEPRVHVNPSEIELQVAEVFDSRLVPASLDSARGLSLARHLVQLCEEYNLDPALVLSLIEVESHFRAEIVSPAGAVGLMQLMPSTAVGIARDIGMNPAIEIEESLSDPFLNLTLGVAYLASLHQRYSDFSTHHILAAYNLGPSRLDKIVAQELEQPKTVQKYSNSVVRGVSKFRLKRPDSHV